MKKKKLIESDLKRLISNLKNIFSESDLKYICIDSIKWDNRPRWEVWNETVIKLVSNIEIYIDILEYDYKKVDLLFDEVIEE